MFIHHRTSYSAWPRLSGEGVDQALAVLEQAVRIDPVNFDSRMGLAMLLDRRGDTAGAIRVLEDGNRWKAVRQYGPPSYRAMLIQFKRKTGDRAGADRLAAEALKQMEARQRKAKARPMIDEWVRRKGTALEKSLFQGFTPVPGFY